jgi:hypothetical protein
MHAAVKIIESITRAMSFGVVGNGSADDAHRMFLGSFSGMMLPKAYSFHSLYFSSFNGRIRLFLSPRY